jgi:hypothetical protein
MNKIKNLECCCCGDSCKGRQWWNRDNGYGVCGKCIAWMRSRKTSETEIRDLYGIEGEHFNCPEPAISKLPEMNYEEKVRFFADDESLRQRILTWQAAGAIQADWSKPNA